MRVGIIVDLRNPPRWRRSWTEVYNWTLDLAERADAEGIGSIWTSEHHLFEDGYLPQPLMMAAAMASRTHNARLGTAVLLAPIRSAAHIFEEAAIVDIISGGRLDLGLGAGYRVPEYELFDVEFGDRYRLLETRTRELLDLDNGRLSVKPGPVQRPLPVWLAASALVGARRAARLGTGLLSPRPDLIREYLQAWEAAGRNPGDAAAAGPLHMIVADDPEKTLAEIAPHIEYWRDSYDRYAVEGTNSPPPPPNNAYELCRPSASGSPARFEILTPAAAISALRERYEGLPVTDLFLWASVAGMPTHIAERNVSLIANVVGPALADVGLHVQAGGRRAATTDPDLGT